MSGREELRAVSTQTLAGLSSRGVSSVKLRRVRCTGASRGLTDAEFLIPDGIHFKFNQRVPQGCPLDMQEVQQMSHAKKPSMLRVGNFMWVHLVP